MEARTRLWGEPESGGYWLRAQPVTKSKGPRLSAPGARIFTTQPDGMWISIEHSNGKGVCCDVLAIEACGSIQNLNDKRSRYFPSSHSIVVTIEKKWLLEEISLPGGGKRERWKAFNSGYGLPVDFPVVLPVRYLRVIYLLKDEHFRKWRINHTPTGHEFFGKLATFENNWRTNTTLKSRLKGISATAHFLTKW